MDVVLAVDIGGTKIEAALVDRGGALIEHTRQLARVSQSDGVPMLLRQVVTKAVRTMSPHMSLVGVGMGVAGPVDRGAGETSCPNLVGLHDQDLRALAREAVVRTPSLASGLGSDFAVVLGLDGGCFALAEAWLGASRVVRDSMAILVSTGVGGGLIFDGRLVTGSSGNCGHIGQIQVDERRPGCSSEAATINESASGPAAVRWARSQGWSGSTGEQLGAAAAHGNRVAQRAISRSANIIGEAVASMSAFLDVNVIAIGGGFSRVSATYVDEIRSVFLECAFFSHARRTQVLPTALDDRGALIGAAALVWSPNLAVSELINAHTAVRG